MAAFVRMILSSVIVLFSFTVLHAADTQVTIPEIKYFQYKLDNGLRIIILEDHKIPMVNFAVWYNVGSIDEPEGITGISHLLEHSMFHGTNALAKDDSWTVMKKVGGSNNAGTFYDYTTYYETVPSAKLELAVVFEADRMRNLNLVPDEFTREKNVVMQERRQSLEGNFFRFAMEEIQADAFQQHGLHHQIVGWMKDLEAITLDDLKNYYTRYYAPNNAIVVISGDVKQKEALTLVKKYFNDYKPQEIVRPAIVEPMQTSERFKRIEKITNTPIVIMYNKIPAGNHKDQVALSTLLTILVNDTNSRVNLKLKNEKQIIMQAFAYNLGLRDTGYAMIGLVANASKDAGRTDDQVLDEVKIAYDAEVKNLIENGITDIELQKVKKDVIKSMVYAKKNTESNAEMIALSYLRYNEPDFYKKELQWFNELTKEDIVKAAKNYLMPEQRTVGYIVKKTEPVVEEKKDTKTDTKKDGKKGK